MQIVTPRASGCRLWEARSRELFPYDWGRGGVRAVMRLHFLGSERFSRTESLTFLLWCGRKQAGLRVLGKRADAFVPRAPHYGESEGISRLLGRCPLLSSPRHRPSRYL